MKKLLCFFVIFSLVATIYVRVVDPLLYAKFIENNVETAGVIDNNLGNNDNILDNGNDTGTTPSEDDNDDEQPGGGSTTGGGNTTEGDNTPIVNPNNPEEDDDDTDYVAPDEEEEDEDTDTVKEIEYVYYTQDKSVTGLTGACLLTSFAMLITNAGRIVGTPKEYGPVDVYLANNPEATSAGDREIIAWYYRLTSAFNYKWWRDNTDTFKNSSNASKEAYVKNLLKDNPWGVIIGGVYGTNGTHYIAVRLDKNGNLLFDDPVKSRGPNLTSISQVYGINDWSKITSVMTITPNLDSNGKWKDGVYDKCKKDPSSCHVCSTKVDC